MILNLETTSIKRINKTQFELNFNLPKIYFKSDQHIHVNEIGITWSKPVYGSNALLYCTLIDKSPMNVNQQLLFIPLRGSNFTYYSPTHIQPYKIQRSELESSQFILDIQEKVEIKKLYLQLHFSNARIQQINPKSF